MKRGLTLAALLTCLLAGGATAIAQDPAAEARLHFDRAVALFESGDARGALAEFQRAYDLSGRASVLYNLGATYQALHDYPRAIDALRRYVASTEGRPTPERELSLRALSQMEPLVAHLRVVRSPADAAVLLDGRALEGDRATVGPGPHVLAASAPEHQPRQVEVMVASGDDREVVVSLTPITQPVAQPVAPPITQPIARPPAAVRAPSRVPFWSMVITGGALAVGASICGALAITTQADYATHRVGDLEAPEIASRGRALAITADVLGIGAAAAGVTALVLGLRGGAAPAARVSVATTAGGALVTVGGRF